MSKYKEKEKLKEIKRKEDFIIELGRIYSKIYKMVDGKIDFERDYPIFLKGSDIINILMALKSLWEQLIVMEPLIDKSQIRSVFITIENSKFEIIKKGDKK